MLSSQYKELHADEQKMYIDMAAQDKIRYVEETKAYAANQMSVTGVQGRITNRSEKSSPFTDSNNDQNSQTQSSEAFTNKVSNQYHIEVEPVNPGLPTCELVGAISRSNIKTCLAKGLLNLMHTLSTGEEHGLAFRGTRC